MGRYTVITRVQPEKTTIMVGERLPRVTVWVKVREDVPYDKLLVGVALYLGGSKVDERNVEITRGEEKSVTLDPLYRAGEPGTYTLTVWTHVKNPIWYPYDDSKTITIRAVAAAPQPKFRIVDVKVEGVKAGNVSLTFHVWVRNEGEDAEATVRILNEFGLMVGMSQPVLIRHGETKEVVVTTMTMYFEPGVERRFRVEVVGPRGEVHDYRVVALKPVEYGPGKQPEEKVPIWIPIAIAAGGIGAMALVWYLSRR